MFSTCAIRIDARLRHVLYNFLKVHTRNKPEVMGERESPKMIYFEYTACGDKIPPLGLLNVDQSDRFLILINMRFA